MLPGQLLWKPSRCHRKIVFRGRGGEGSMLPGQLLWKPSRCHRKIVFKSQQENPVKAVQTERDSKKDRERVREKGG